MKELGWQLDRNKYGFLLLFLVFGGMLGPIFVILGKDTMTEAVYRVGMLFIGLAAFSLYAERQGMLVRKNCGASFYRSMADSFEKERKRWLVLDVFFCVLSVLGFVAYKCIGELVMSGKNGNAVFCVLLVYLAGSHLFVKHPVGQIAITILALVFLGFSIMLVVPVWGVGLAVVLFLCCEVFFYKKFKRLWKEE